MAEAIGGVTSQGCPKVTNIEVGVRQSADFPKTNAEARAKVVAQQHPTLPMGKVSASTMKSR